MLKFIIISLAFAGLAVNQGQAQRTEAKCEINADNSDPDQPISGVIRLVEEDNGEMRIGVSLAGFTRRDGINQHDLRIHSVSDINDKCSNVGEDFTGGGGGSISDLGRMAEQNDDGKVAFSFKPETPFSLLDNRKGNIVIMGKPIVVHLGPYQGRKLGCCIITKAEDNDYRTSKCTLRTGKVVGGNNLQGDITITQLSRGGMVDYNLNVRGFTLKDAEYGFHVHEVDDTSNQCKASGNHFNPDYKNHGGKDSLNRHVGDLGNLRTSRTSDTLRTTIYDDVSSLVGVNNVVRKTLVIHERRDDEGAGGNEESRISGNAGDPLACCVIEQPVEGNANIENTASSIPAVTIASFLSTTLTVFFVMRDRLI